MPPGTAASQTSSVTTRDTRLHLFRLLPESSCFLRSQEARQLLACPAIPKPHPATGVTGLCHAACGDGEHAARQALAYTTRNPYHLSPAHTTHLYPRASRRAHAELPLSTAGPASPANERNQYGNSRPGPCTADKPCGSASEWRQTLTGKPHARMGPGGLINPTTQAATRPRPATTGSASHNGPIMQR